MTYRAAITDAMTELARDPLVSFYGYGLARGKAMGTLSGVAVDQIVETPVAENLMMGLAIGAALTGRRPLVYFERADFLLCGADAIVNHLDKLGTMSRGEFAPGVIIRVTVGNKTKPLFTGETHTQDLSEAFKAMVAMPVYRLNHESEVADIYAEARAEQKLGISCMVFEYKDKFA